MKNSISLSALMLALFAAAPQGALAQTAQPAPAIVTRVAAEGTQPSLTAAAQDDTKKARTSLKEYDLGKKNVALEGYDPVAYFPKFGGKATKGNKSITHTHRGVLYRFSSASNKAAFVADPNRFEPMYGGWCAWAMSDGKGDKTGANPKSFEIEDGRLYVFYDGFFGDTRKTWNKKGKAPKLKGNADKNWKRMSGEAARPGDSKQNK